MKKLRAAIIGLGVGEKHLDAYLRHPQCEVAGVCDFCPHKLEEIANKYPKLFCCSEADRLLDDPNVDIVSIASYDNCHYLQVAKALANKKHVFVEKPLCLFESEARDIRALLRKNPEVRLSSNLILRMAPRFIRLKKMIANRELGDLFYVEGDYNYGRLQKITQGWRGRLNFYSVVYGGGVHIIDLLLWLTQDEVVEVAAFGNQIASRGSGFRFDDMVVSMLRFKSGLIGKMAVNFGCVFPHFHNLILYGTQATFVNDRAYGFLYTSRDKQQEPIKITEEYPGAGKGELLYNFIEAVLGREECLAPEDEVFKAMSVCFAIEKAAHASQTIQVEYI